MLVSHVVRGIFEYFTENLLFFIKIMEELKDVSIHHTALKILAEITAMKGYDENIYKTVQVLVFDCV